ncbi:hypothetical protein L1987_63508 [Smallanthus sonchifolius]|uniref:Uncharacterized protein n=1 Tax=Smallanthus sonchifolius TaxID=185202 RepID=A0ACB9CDG3_9ASTR|nr:hypothetical protein L1987_63508 [Smallanthus sonchifolius]
MKNSLFTYNALSREFDENYLRRFSEHFYEDEVLNLPSAPDVCSYLMPEADEVNSIRDGAVNNLKRLAEEFGRDCAMQHIVAQKDDEFESLNCQSIIELHK